MHVSEKTGSHANMAVNIKKVNALALVGEVVTLYQVLKR